jgi:hypothetical protein
MQLGNNSVRADNPLKSISAVVPPDRVAACHGLHMILPASIGLVISAASMAQQFRTIPL